MVTNRCYDIQKSARKKREQYFGEWLPEPLFHSSAGDDSIESVERSDLLSYAMIVLLERLTPAERVVFVLREALGFDYAEIAELMEKARRIAVNYSVELVQKWGLPLKSLFIRKQPLMNWLRTFCQHSNKGI